MTRRCWTAISRAICVDAPVTVWLTIRARSGRPCFGSSTTYSCFAHRVFTFEATVTATNTDWVVSRALHFQENQTNDQKPSTTARHGKAHLRFPLTAFIACLGGAVSDGWHNRH